MIRQERDTAQVERGVQHVAAAVDDDAAEGVVEVGTLHQLPSQRLSCVPPQVPSVSLGVSPVSQARVFRGTKKQPLHKAVFQLVLVGDHVGGVKAQCAGKVIHAAGKAIVQLRLDGVFCLPPRMRDRKPVSKVRSSTGARISKSASADQAVQAGGAAPRGRPRQV